MTTTTIARAHNRPSLDDITADPGVLKNQPLDVIDMLLGEAKALRDKASVASKVLQGALETRYAAPLQAAFAGAGKDTGTVRVVDGMFELVADRPKRVEWDQRGLAAAAAKITAAGDDTAEYLNVTYTVDERKFTAWPTHIRSVFEDARTVKPGPTTIKLVRRSAETEGAA